MNIRILQKQTPSKNGSFIQKNPNISYLLTAGQETKQSLLIDAGGIDTDQLDGYLDTEHSTLTGVVLTHFHADHVFDLGSIIHRFPSINLYMHNISANQAVTRDSVNVVPLAKNQILNMAGTNLMVLSTPGHTNDSICIGIAEEKILFTGDCLFGGGIGCCDYAHGGNRNIFYHTLGDLLIRLPRETSIYPGHFSEDYQKSPPYSLESERIINPYLDKVINGRRGDFDRALKQFSLEFETNNHTLLSEQDIDQICELEKSTWIPELQATRDMILSRLHSGHRMLAIMNNKELAGMVCWRYSEFSLADPIENFPRDFFVFSLQKSAEKSKARSAYVYNLGVRSISQKSGTGSALLQWAFETIRSEGINQVFVDSRIPSYQGSSYGIIENIPEAPAFKKSIDQYLSQNKIPAMQRLYLDPTLRFYMANGFKPWLIFDNFIQDRPSGNIRVICYINLEQEQLVKLDFHPVNDTPHGKRGIFKCSH